MVGLMVEGERAAKLLVCETDTPPLLLYSAPSQRRSELRGGVAPDYRVVLLRCFTSLF